MIRNGAFCGFLLDLADLWYTADSNGLKEDDVRDNIRPLALVPDLDELAEHPATRAKLARLHSILDGLGSVVVAFSGGVDSAFLLYIAHARLLEKAVGLTVVSPSRPTTAR